MQASHYDVQRPRWDRGPALYFGYCGRTGRYRMMDLPEYLSNVQDGVSRMVSDASAAYERLARGYGDPARTGPGVGVRARQEHACGCGTCGCGTCDCHCECCVCDADVLVHARCNEVRRIAVTFENDTRRERPVKLELDSFTTAGGREVKWSAQLSETSFVLKPCDEHTITVTVQVRCDAFGGETPNPDTGAAPRQGSVDRCEVAYARLRADGCLVRPVVLAVAVLPDDCDAYKHPCSCGCCH